MFLFAMSKGEYRNLQLVKGLRLRDHGVLSLEKDISITPHHHGLENVTEEEAVRI